MRILHVGLPNSVHLARWIDTLAGTDWDQHLLSVSRWSPPCDELRGVTLHYPGARSPVRSHPGVTIVGAPSQSLAETIRAVAPDIVHAHGIQLAGYPTLGARAAYEGPFPPWIVSCWGSDIFHYGAEPEHAAQIRAVLAAADCFVADSRRDLRLARGFGLHGGGVQVGSVAGGFDLARLASYRQPGLTSARRTIMVKGRNVWVYRGLVALEALARNADLLRGYRVVVYADQEGEMRNAVKKLAQAPGVEAVLLPHVPYEEILRSHGRARISISLSVSDGTNLSFLEAIAMGSFPIQSERSATIEWAQHGETALFVGAEDVDEVAAAIRRALTDGELVDRAAEINGQAVAARLGMPQMRAQVSDLYERVVARTTTRGSGRCSQDAVPEGGADAESEHATNLPAAQAPTTAQPAVSAASDDPGVTFASVQRHDPRVDPRLPLVTLVTPTYNRADLLPETIESILSQDYPNIEYIVLDDGSTDNTLELLRSYGDALRWEHHPNMGQARTVNRGFEMARGEILGTISSDDPLLPGAISAIVKTFLAHPEVVLVYPDWSLNDEKGSLLYSIRTFDYSHVDMVRWHHTYPGPCTLFRRSVFERVGGYDPSYRFLPDYEFFLRAGLLGPFLREPRTLATYRSHEGTITNAERGEAMAKEHVRCIEQFYSRDDLPPEVLAVKTEAFRNAYIIGALVCMSDPPRDERYLLTDKLSMRMFAAPGLDGIAAEMPAVGALAISLVDQMDSVLPTAMQGSVRRWANRLPIRWRVAIRRSLNRAIPIYRTVARRVLAHSSA